MISNSLIIVILLMLLPVTFIWASNHSKNDCVVYREYKNQSNYILPLKGKWMVLSGGCRKKDNIHNNVIEQKFAYDFVQTNSKGLYYNNDGKKLVDYYAYNQDILALADGEVVQIVDGIEDSLIGKQNRYFFPGNMIVIKHSLNEYSFIAHIKKRSFLVREGDKVKKGQRLAKVGNSGNSSMPHIHLQLGDSQSFESTKSIPLNFTKILVDGEERKNYKPFKGEVVRNID